MKCQFISLTVALLLSFVPLFAQTVFVVKGTVTDEEGMPLYGCIVSISETKGTVTDSLGHYSLPIPNDKAVEIHYECLGYEEVVLTYSPESSFLPDPDVKLRIDPTLPDVVIIMDPSPTPVRREEPQTLSLDTHQEDILAKETKQEQFFSVSASVIPDEVRFITLYTQIGKAGILYPYVIRFEDEAGKPIYRKEAKKVLRCIKKQAVDSIRFEGFVLRSVGNMVDDAAAQKAADVVENYGLHDYGKRDTPVYYFERQKKDKSNPFYRQTQTPIVLDDCLGFASIGDSLTS